MNNKQTEFSINRDGHILDYCRLKDITIQAWSPLQVGMFGGTFIDNPDFPKLNETLAKIGEREGVSKTAVAIAWILRHPAKMQAIIGTMNPAHIKDACAASEVKLSHHDWYALYLAAGKYLIRRTKFNLVLHLGHSFLKVKAEKPLIFLSSVSFE